MQTFRKRRAGLSATAGLSCSESKNVTYYVFWLCFIHFLELVRPSVHASVHASQNIVDMSWCLERYWHIHQTYNNDALWNWHERINYWGKKINSYCHSIFWKYHCSGGCIKYWTIIYRLRVCGYVIRNRYHYPHIICFELYVSVEMYRRLLFEISKLSTEVQQLRRLIERQSCGRCNNDTGTVIPELACGPIKTVEEYSSLVERCGAAEFQAALVCCLPLVTIMTACVCHFYKYSS